MHSLVFLDPYKRAVCPSFVHNYSFIYVYIIHFMDIVALIAQHPGMHPIPQSHRSSCHMSNIFVGY